MELLVPVAANTEGADITEVSLAALSLGMVFVGTCNDEVRGVHCRGGKRRGGKSVGRNEEERGVVKRRGMRRRGEM